MARKFMEGLLWLTLVAGNAAVAQVPASTVVVRPREIHDVLNNPGIGFMTFQRFNGDELNPGAGWTEGLPIEYQAFDGDLRNENYPQTSLAYFRVYWKYVEPEAGRYDWQMIDEALATAESRGQSLLLRIAPYGSAGEHDVPAWYRAMVGGKREWGYRSPVNGWLVDPEDPRYARYFGHMIASLGKRYDGHPALNAVDLSFIGAWGEGAGSELLSERTRRALVDAYTDNFTTTPLIALLMDEKTNRYAIERGNGRVGWRVDCVGDLGFWAADANGWTHMYDYYPQSIIRYGTQDAWKSAPVSLEICGTFLRWRDQEKYTAADVKYIFDQTLKWHISSFNAKSSPVPPEWAGLVDDWLKKMGYRFVLRKFTYPQTVERNHKLDFTSWWENKGVAPCYEAFPLAIRLKNEQDERTFITRAHIPEWLPGDNLYDDAIFIPSDMKPGEYELQIALLDRHTHEPKVLLAIEGRNEAGWYALGKINVE